MQTNILKKAIEELNSETPRLDYIRGMLETLVAMEPESLKDAIKQTLPKPNNIPAVMTQGLSVVGGNEGDAIDAMGAAAMHKVKGFEVQ